MENSITHLSLDLYNFVHHLFNGHEKLLEQYPGQLKKPLLKLLFSVYQATLLTEDNPDALSELFKISTDIELLLSQLEECKAHSMMLECVEHMRSKK